GCYALLKQSKGLHFLTLRRRAALFPQILQCGFLFFLRVSLILNFEFCINKKGCPVGTPFFIASDFT
ncbi:MAG: hypothetical protein Q4F42_07105, partial [Rikenellaceae bacterium]|nr:hypothetical protein [Rikenellaceae bacterium]